MRGHGVSFSYSMFWFEPELRHRLALTSVNMERLQRSPFVRIEEKAITFMSEYCRHGFILHLGCAKVHFFCGQRVVQ